MNFRTEIEIPKKPCFTIEHSEPIVMLGSCFTDNIGEKLAFDGFDVVHNPMGALYNPASILSAITLALHDDAREALTIRRDDSGIYHCLNFASKYADDSESVLRATVCADLAVLGASLRRARTVIITLGTAYVFALNASTTNPLGTEALPLNRCDEPLIVGNCHKFPASAFTRYRLDVEAIIRYLHQIVDMLPDKRVIFTVSPIRHVADGLHGNQLSKASLLLALDAVIDNHKAYYFPAYEIVLDDLRDYRFYAPDMKHPSTVAVDYIYEVFASYYFSPATRQQALSSRRLSLRSSHRPLL